MKTLLRYTNRSLQLFWVGLCLIMVGAFSAFSQANPRFSEVDPVNDEVTITNYGDAAVNLMDYWLCLRPGTYVRIGTITPVSGMMNLMPNATIVLSYDIDPAGDGLALYNRGGSFTSPDAMDDFMQWKEGGTARENVAVEAQLWGMGEFIEGDGPYTYTGDGSENGSESWSAATVMDVDGGEITGGPFEIVVDGNADMIPAGSITLEGAVGSNMSWVITDADLKILGLPPTLAAVEGVNFDDAGVGVCLIWHISHDGTLMGAEVDANAADLTGNFDLSNPIEVIRASEMEVEGGTLTGGPFEFLVDGNADMIPANSITLDGAIGDNSGWVITDADLKILGLPPTLAAVEGVDFDGAGVGVCLIWHISHDGSLSGAMQGANAADLKGNFSLSNSIEVSRASDAEVEGGTLTGGPFEFLVDGNADMIPANSITLDGAVGDNSGWVITDADLKILGLPPTLAAVEGVDFDGAGVGVCIIWHISHDGSLSGAMQGANAADLKGNFSLSNSITVSRKDVSGGTITGGPFEFLVDGNADMIPVDSITLEGAVGSNMSWVITDADLNILGLPPTLADVEGVDFDGAGVGVCLIWNISHDGTLMGAEVDENAADLTGNFDLSNPIEVIRFSNEEVEGGTLTGGPFTFCASDGAPDMVPEGSIVLDEAVGSNMGWVITDADLNILGLPPTLAAVEGVNFDDAGEGVCLIWHISHDGSLSGAEAGANAANLKGNFSLSNAIEVTRLTGSDCDTLSTEDFDTGLSVTIFPVPASSELQVRLTARSATITLEVYDIIGKKVMQKDNVSSSNASINISELQQGTYILAISTDQKERTTKRFTVVK